VYAAAAAAAAAAAGLSPSERASVGRSVLSVYRLA
jgi:hypothetical protein